MFTLSDVIESLRGGPYLSTAFVRHFASSGKAATEFLSPIGDSYFRHDVTGHAHGGWGGSAELSIEVLENGRWAEHGWMPIDYA